MAKLVDRFTDMVEKALRVNPGRGTPLPRKGAYPFMNTIVNKKQQKQFTLNSATLGRLANTDPITWAIRRVIKGYISQTKWDIVPDTDCMEAELDRWEDSILTSINPYDIETSEYKSEVLPTELQEEIRSKVKSLLGDSKSKDDESKRAAIRWYFKTISKRIRQDAESHKHKVKNLFEHPNTTETSFRTLMELVLDDVLIYDAGVIVKNYDHLGNLAELYTLPGQEIKIYRNQDRTMPVAPESAYVWEDKGVTRAEYTNDELVYITQNPQQSGYGLSPLEVAAYVITASLYADTYNIDYFKNSNVPPGVLNLGEGVTEDQRLFFQKMWDEEIQGRGGLHKLLFAAGTEKMQFIPMRVQSNRDMQMMEYLKWTVAIKCACYGISAQDIGFILDFHRTVAEVQERLSKSRGINTLLNLMECYFNEEIVKAEFGFQDVKFEWQIADRKENVQQAQIDKLDIDTGVISINERRKKLGKKPLEGGDEAMVKTGAGMVPVKDMEKLSDPNAVQGLEGLMGGQTPGPTPQFQMPGEPGRPSLGEEKSGINLFVNRNNAEKIQNKMAKEAIKELKNKGINATIKIGFTNDKKT